MLHGARAKFVAFNELIYWIVSYRLNTFSFDNVHPQLLFIVNCVIYNTENDL